MGSTVFGMDYCMDGLKGMGMDCFVVKIIMKRNIKKYKKELDGYVLVCMGMDGYGWVWGCVWIGIGNIKGNSNIIKSLDIV